MLADRPSSGHDRTAPARVDGAAALGEVVVDIWTWGLDRSPQAVADCARILSNDEKERAARFVRPIHAERFQVARAGLRNTLARYVPKAARDLTFTEGRRGKPGLDGGPAFNLSHSGNLAALAVCADAEIDLGVDIELYRFVEEDIAKRVFTQAERDVLNAVRPEKREAAFFHGWTQKEAVIKAIGEGLYADLMSVDVTLDPDQPPAVLEAKGSFPAARAWQLQPLDLGPGVSGTCAAVTHGRPLKLRLRSPSDGLDPKEMRKNKH